jgi:hypothetical protein
MPACPNCGKDPARFDKDGYCTYCWWQKGEEPFCPHWMDQETWEEGMRVNWRVVRDRRNRKDAPAQDGEMGDPLFT